MKKILIAYSSKTGTAAQCVGLLEKELKGLCVTVADLDQTEVCVRDYDIVILGSSVRFAALRKSVVKLLKEQGNDLQERTHGLFLCCGFGHAFEGYAANLFPAALTESAFAVMNFGGTLKLEKAGLLERILLHSIRSSIQESELDDGEYTPTLPSILPENISRMADLLRTAL